MRKITVLAQIASVALTVIFAGVFLAIGIFLIIAPCRQYMVDPLIQGYKLWSIIIGILMVIMFIKYIAAMLLRTRRHQSISFDNPDGAVEIAVHAIEESIARLVGNYNEVKGAYPAVTATNDGVDALIKVVLWDDANVQAVSQRIQNETKAHISNFFGVANVNNVKVFVSGTAKRMTTKNPPDNDTGAEDAIDNSGANVQF